MAERFLVTYHVRAGADTIAARAQAIAVEQSVEMPLEAIEAPEVLRDIVGQVADIADSAGACSPCGSRWQVRNDRRRRGAVAGNMLFGNTSLH